MTNYIVNAPFTRIIFPKTRQQFDKFGSDGYDYVDYINSYNLNIIIQENITVTPLGILHSLWFYLSIYLSETRGEVGFGLLRCISKELVWHVKVICCLKMLHKTHDKARHWCLGGAHFILSCKGMFYWPCVRVCKYDKSEYWDKQMNGTKQYKYEFFHPLKNCE